jgi:hypothetical protein
LYYSFFCTVLKRNCHADLPECNCALPRYCFNVSRKNPLKSSSTTVQLYAPTGSTVLAVVQVLAQVLEYWGSMHCRQTSKYACPSPICRLTGSTTISTIYFRGCSWSRSMRIVRPSIGVEFAIVVNNDSNVNPLSLTGSRFGWIIMQEDQGLEATPRKWS